MVQTSRHPYTRKNSRYCCPSTFERLPFRQHISAQLINDDTGRTICAASDMNLPQEANGRATQVGETIAKAAVAAV